MNMLSKGSNESLLLNRTKVQFSTEQQICILEGQQFNVLHFGAFVWVPLKVPVALLASVVMYYTPANFCKK